MPSTYPVIDFHQFGGQSSKDRLLLFAAPAKQIAIWAGIPRKGWRIRMLFQRWIAESRETELKEFWLRASNEKEGFILGPSAITVAIQGDPKLEDGRISLAYDPPFDDEKHSPVEQLQIIAKEIFPMVNARFKDDAAVIKGLETFKKKPLTELPKVHHNYVFEFALQLIQMKSDPQWFVETNQISEHELKELITSMESLCRPALVVDGQHRLWGASHHAVDDRVHLPVVAMTNSDWVQQIYQFVVINEKAQKVNAELLNDIFASSLTPSEQSRMRTSFSQVKVDIEQRIAGVLAGRDPHSPFYHMVTLNLPNAPKEENDAYISQNIIQCLINGGRGARGWRSDDEFFDNFVAPTFPDRKMWEGWKDGKWQDYWFVFWKTVADYYSPLAKKIKTKEFEIWDQQTQSNLTKGVGLKIFQRFYMEEAVSQMQELSKSLNVLREVLSEEEAKSKIEEKIAEKAIPLDPADFGDRIRGDFLEKFPVRFFTANWETSLDDSTGQEKLLIQMREAFKRDDWRASGGGVFVPANS